MVPRLPGGDFSSSTSLLHRSCTRTCGGSLREPGSIPRYPPYPRYTPEPPFKQSSPMGKASGSQTQFLGVFYLQRWAVWYTQPVWPHQLLWGLSLSREIVPPSWIICWPSLSFFQYPLPNEKSQNTETAGFYHLIYVQRLHFFLQWTGLIMLKDYFKIKNYSHRNADDCTDLWPGFVKQPTNQRLEPELEIIFFLSEFWKTLVWVFCHGFWLSDASVCPHVQVKCWVTGKFFQSSSVPLWSS